MTEISVNDFVQELECQFEGEVYSVRDNGAVLRHSRSSGRTRSVDNKWTFGKSNSTNPYLLIAGVRVHRIIAVAFHGTPPRPDYVVDHVDSNCRNNRPENLRWLTRLENTLKNPITRKKIEYLCGSIEAFLENPSMLNDLGGDPNFTWMRTVSKEEAQHAKMRMDLWVRQERSGKKPASAFPRRGASDDDRFRPLQKWEAGLRGEPGLDFSLTPWCAQFMWGPPVHFPCCPQDYAPDSLERYFQNIQIGALFAFNDENLFPRLTVSEKVFNEEGGTVCLLCSREDKNWAVVGFYLNEKAHFIHYHVGSFKKIEDAKQTFYSLKRPENLWSRVYSPKWEPQ